MTERALRDYCREVHLLGHISHPPADESCIANKCKRNSNKKGIREEGGRREKDTPRGISISAVAKDRASHNAKSDGNSPRRNRNVDGGEQKRCRGRWPLNVARSRADSSGHVRALRVL